MRIFFFATGDDIRPVLRRVEAEMPLKFVDIGITTSPERPVYRHSDDIPSIGISEHHTGQIGISYLVSPRHSKYFVEKFRHNDGDWRWHVCNGNNPDSIVFSPGGLWKNEVLLDGGVHTLYDTSVTDRLMRLFLTSIRQERFTNLEQWWFGPEAFGMWRDGGRLTHSVQSPPEFDFEFPEELRRFPSKI